MNMTWNNNLKTTLAGLLASIGLCVSNIDLSELLAGDPLQIAHTAAALLVWVIGVLATHARRDGHTTLLGVIAGALQACSGQASDITVAIVMAATGYLTNKPASNIPA
jgi:hypothetical protein